MKFLLIAALVQLLFTIAVKADDPVLDTSQQGTATEIRAGEILDQASEIVVRQSDELSFEFGHILGRIAQLQIQAREFEGAHQSVKNCGYPYRKNATLIKLAEALATAGQIEKATEVVRELGTDHGWRQDTINDDVQMCWIDFLISADQLDAAQKAIEELETSAARPAGLCKLAQAYATGEDKTTSSRLFQNAIAATTEISNEFDQAKALWEIVDAQIQAGKNESAAATIDDLVSRCRAYENGWTRVRACCEAGIRTTRLTDKQAAKSLFRQAIEARKMVDEKNSIHSLKMIAMAQVTAGLIDDALDTAAMIKHSESDFTHDGKREEVLCAVAVAQAKSGKLADAIAITKTIQHYIQYQNDAFLAIVEQHIENGDNESALATAWKIANPTRRATAILKVATKYATNGDATKAKEIAGSIQLEVADDVLSLREESSKYKFSSPETWGVLYDQNGFYTNLSHSFTVNRAADLAAATMTLAQAIDDFEKTNYADSFKSFEKNVVESLARAHAMHGDPREAYEWASKIGSQEEVEPDGEFDTEIAVRQRIHALVGVAAGLLEKHGPDSKQK